MPYLDWAEFLKKYPDTIITWMTDVNEPAFFFSGTEGAHFFQALQIVS